MSDQTAPQILMLSPSKVMFEFSHPMHAAATSCTTVSSSAIKACVAALVVSLTISFKPAVTSSTTLKISSNSSSSKSVSIVQGSRLFSQQL